MAVCSIAGCVNTTKTLGWCRLHYERFRRHGDPLVTLRRPREPDGVCAIDGCSSPLGGGGYCGKHYARFKRTGDPLATRWEPRAVEQICAVCGLRDWGGTQRRTCSQRCAQLYYRNAKTSPARAAVCVQCGDEIDLFVVGKAGRKKRADVKLCTTCKRAKSLRHKVSVAELAARDGIACGICGHPVDMGLRAPHPASSSIDHIIPVARGGSHELSNLQLAHARCNHVKSDRFDGAFDPAGETGAVLAWLA